MDVGGLFDVEGLFAAVNNNDDELEVDFFDNLILCILTSSFLAFGLVELSHEDCRRFNLGNLTLSGSLIAGLSLMVLLIGTKL